MTEYPDAKWVAATRNIVVVGKSRSEDEVFLCPNGVYDLYKSRGYIRDVPPPGEEPAEAESAEAAPEAESGGEEEFGGEEEPQPEEEPAPEEEREADEGEAEAEAPEWDLQMAPDTYLKRYPDGDHAEKARAVLEARGDEIPDEA